MEGGTRGVGSLNLNDIKNTLIEIRLKKKSINLEL